MQVADQTWLILPQDAASRASPTLTVNGLCCCMRSRCSCAKFGLASMDRYEQLLYTLGCASRKKSCKLTLHK
jgi:hypothetical protein